MDLTIVITAVITAVVSILTGVVAGRRKTNADGINQEIQNLKEASAIWRENALEFEKRTQLLQKQIIEKNEVLTKAIYQLKDAIYYAKKCPYSDSCPVLLHLDRMSPTKNNSTDSDSSPSCKGYHKGHNDTDKAG